MLESPIATFRLGRSANLPFGGGGYLRLLPWWYTRLGLARARSERLPVVVYIHPWEIDPGQPKLAVGAKSRLRHYANLGKTHRRLDRLVQRESFTSFRRLEIAPDLPTVDPKSWRTA